MKTYDITIKGTQPLLMHHDDIEWSDVMDEWKNDPKHKQSSKPGDDRTPAHRWIGCLYKTEDHVVMPTENIMRALMEAGTQVLVPGGRSGKTFKAQTQSGILMADHGWPMMVGGKPIPSKPIDALKNVKDFAAHREAVAKMGFSLFMKRAKVGSSKHVRVRPLFEKGWTASGQIIVVDDALTESVLRTIFEIAGKYKGLGDWRPGGKTPGTYGMFAATVKPA